MTYKEFVQAVLAEMRKSNFHPYAIAQDLISQEKDSNKRMIRVVHYMRLRTFFVRRSTGLNIEDRCKELLQDAAVEGIIHAERIAILEHIIRNIPEGD